MNLTQKVEGIWSANGSSRGIGDRCLCAGLRAGLRAGSVAYWMGACVRSMAFATGLAASRKVSCPVISIGNLTVGGTGKTPIVMEAARILSQSGLRPAVVSRGYRRADPSGVVVVSNGREILSDLGSAGDEPMMMARRLLASGISDVSVVVGARRYEAAARAIEECGANAILLDDGFQHRALARDCDIVLWDALRPLESLAMFPRGPMREGMSALRRAHALVFTRCNLGNSTKKALSRIKRIAPHLVIFHANLEAESLLPLDGAGESSVAELKGRRVGAFCGLGNPDSFWRLLEQCGAEVVARRVFADHHRPDVEELDGWCGRARQEGAEVILLTEKDRENLPVGWRPSLAAFVLRTNVSFGDEGGRFGEFLLRHAQGG